MGCRYMHAGYPLMGFEVNAWDDLLDLVPPPRPRGGHVTTTWRPRDGHVATTWPCDFCMCRVTTLHFVAAESLFSHDGYLTSAPHHGHHASPIPATHILLMLSYHLSRDANCALQISHRPRSLSSDDGVPSTNWATTFRRARGLKSTAVAVELATHMTIGRGAYVSARVGSTGRKMDTRRWSTLLYRPWPQLPGPTRPPVVAVAVAWHHRGLVQPLVCVLARTHRRSTTERDL